MGRYESLDLPVPFPEANNDHTWRAYDCWRPSDGTAHVLRASPCCWAWEGSHSGDGTIVDTDELGSCEGAAVGDCRVVVPMSCQGSRGAKGPGR